MVYGVWYMVYGSTLLTEYKYEYPVPLESESLDKLTLLSCATKSTVETVYSFYWNGLHTIKTGGLTMDVVLWICSLIIHVYMISYILLMFDHSSFRCKNKK